MPLRKPDPVDLRALRRILVLRLSALGDVLLTTPVLRLLRNHCPEARLEVMTNAVYADLLRANPCVDQIHLFDPQQGVRAVLRNMRHLHYDVVLDLHRTLRSRLLYYGLRATHKIAYTKYTLRRACLVHWGWDTLRTLGPVPERYAAPLRRWGVTAPLPPMELHLTPASQDAMRAYLAQALPASVGRPLLAVAPGARWPTKCWSVDHFAAVAQAVVQAQGAAVVVLGGHGDVSLGQALCQRLRAPVLDSTGQLSLMDTAALLHQCHLFLGNDSGLMHMATALGVPAVAVFGPTVEAFGFYPFTARARVISAPVACRPCSTKGSLRCPRGHHRCMTQITPAQVYAAVSDLWTEPAT